GRTTCYYVGNPRQLARNLLLCLIRSPLNSGRTESFRFETPDIEIKSRREVMEKVDAWRARAGSKSKADSIGKT
ncbi:MAG: hypothetical protein L0213_10040, partial [Candidatus Dadabacteria bacterium]|nr:hypothetical protein [Candidatus Dadabacteria bacterium]